jgi:anti-sigma B factor antagonist
MTALPGPCSERLCTVYIDGALIVPVNPDLLTKVRAFLRGGNRSILLDLSSVPFIDAGGIGELVRAYDIASAMDVALRIAHATDRVRELLERVGLFDLLSAPGNTGTLRARSAGPNQATSVVHSRAPA